MIGPAGRSDAGAFLVRLLRLDPAALVRMRPARLYPSQAELWARLPFEVMVCRALADSETGDATVEAAALLRHLEGGPFPERRDAAWRWPLPSRRGEPLEEIPSAEINRVASAASQTLREAFAGALGDRQVGERVVRDALLDHVPIVVTDASGLDRVEVPQRLVQAVVRMGFIPPDNVARLTQGDTSVTVRRVGRWLGLDGSYGSAWYLPISRLHLS